VVEEPFRRHIADILDEQIRGAVSIAGKDDARAVW
jgi:hypothetical protein